MPKVPAPLILAGALALLLVGCSSSPNNPNANSDSAPAAEEEAETSPSPTPEPEPEPEVEVGTRANPHPVGTPVLITDGSVWTVTLGPTNLEATAAVVALPDQYNTAPAAGTSYILLPVTLDVADNGATVIPAEGADPVASLSFDYVSAAGNTYSTYTGPDYCYTAASVSGIGAMYSGASATGDVCMAVPTDQIAGGAWKVTHSVSGTAQFFAAA